MLSDRRLLGHIIRGRKKASYKHYDSYPEGLGVQLVQYIKSLTDEQIEQMISALEQIEWSVPAAFKGKREANCSMQGRRAVDPIQRTARALRECSIL